VVDAPLRKWYKENPSKDPFTDPTIVDIDTSKGLWIWSVLVFAFFGKFIELNNWATLNPSEHDPAASGSGLTPLNPLISLLLFKSNGIDTIATWLAHALAMVPLGLAISSFGLALLLFSMESLQRYAQVTVLPPSRPLKMKDSTAATTVSHEPEEDEETTKAEKELAELRARYPCPESSCSWLSRLTFSFVDPMLFTGAQKPLEDADIWALPPEHYTSEVIREFNETKHRTRDFKGTLIAMFKWRFLSVCAATVVTSILSFAGPFFLNRIITFLEQPRKPGEDNSHGYWLMAGMLLCSLLRSILSNNVYQASTKNAINVRSVLVSEIYAKSLRRAGGFSAPPAKSKDTPAGKADSKQDGSPSSGPSSPPNDEGKAKASIGKIVSLMSTDANRLYSMLGYFHAPLVDFPIKALISVVSLLYLLGPSALVGLLLVVITGPLTGIISGRMMKGQISLSEASDKRTQMTNEVLQGIKVIKFFAWEPEFQRRILEARETELHRNMALWIYYLSFFVIAQGSSVFVILLSFATYSLVFGNVLTAATAFTSITLLRQVSSSLNALPMIGMQITRAKVAVDRIADFINEKELEKYEEKKESAPTNSNSDERTPLLFNSTSSSSMEEANDVPLPENYVKPAVGFYQGKFEYFGNEPEQKKPTAATPHSPQKKTILERFRTVFQKQTSAASPTDPPSSAPQPPLEQPSTATETTSFELRNLTLSFPIGLLSVITGATGSGKTSLVLSLLGELRRTQGHSFLPDPRSITGGIAYVPQTAFLLNGTIRENILFGEKFDKERYKRVIRAAALERDLEILEGGDLTEIGEKGVNLSGGQKQRISLARAAYSRSQIILLDDCLSAVDAPTARFLVDECICGEVMNGRTRILVSHAVSLVLPEAGYGMYIFCSSRFALSMNHDCSLFVFFIYSMAYFAVVVMKNGEVAAQGSLEDVLNNPAVSDMTLGSGLTQQGGDNSSIISKSKSKEPAKESAKNEKTQKDGKKDKLKKLVKCMILGFVSCVRDVLTNFAFYFQLSFVAGAR
jgi:ABC-type multidrug transport system fused ATPase/permease subunit